MNLYATGGVEGAASGAGADTNRRPRRTRGRTKEKPKTQSLRDALVPFVVSGLGGCVLTAPPLDKRSARVQNRQLPLPACFPSAGELLSQPSRIESRAPRPASPGANLRGIADSESIQSLQKRRARAGQRLSDYSRGHVRVARPQRRGQVHLDAHHRHAAGTGQRARSIWARSNVLRQKQELRKTLGYLPQEFGVYPRTSAQEMLNHLALLKGITDAKQRKDTVEALLQPHQSLRASQESAVRILGRHAAALRHCSGAARATPAC